MRTRLIDLSLMNIFCRSIGKLISLILLTSGVFFFGVRPVKAALTSYVDASNILYVISDADDDITITCVSNSILINGFDPDSGTFQCDKLTGISITGGPGDNSIDVSSLSLSDLASVTQIIIEGSGGGDTIYGGANPEILSGGDGNDMLFSGYGSDNLDGGEDSDIYYVQPDPSQADLVLVDDSGSAGTDKLQVIGTSLSDQFSTDELYINLGSAAVSFDPGIEENELIGSGGADLFLLGAVPYSTSVYGGSDADDIQVHSIGAAVFLDGEDGDDSYQINFGSLLATVSILDSGKTGVDNLVANGTKGDDSMELAHYSLKSGSETIQFVDPDTLEAATILAGDGKDLFLLLCDRFTVDFFGGPGSDTMTVNHFEQPTLLDGGEDGDTYEVNFGNLLATLSIDDKGTSGTDTLTANGTAGDDSMELAHYSLKSGSETIQFVNPDTLEAATILAGDGKDLFLLLCDRFTVDFFGGPGSDTMTVNHFEQPTLLDGGEDGDTYEVNFGNLLATLSIDDKGTSGTDTLTANGTAGDDSMELAHYSLKSGSETIQFVNPDTLEAATILAGDGKDLFLLLCDRFTVDFFGGPGSDTMTVNHFEQPTLLDGGEDGDTYEVNFGNLLASLSIDDKGLAGSDLILAKAPGALIPFRQETSVNWLITPSQVSSAAEGLAYSGEIETLSFIGSPDDELIQVSPSPTTVITIFGGGHSAGDNLIVDAGGLPYTSLPGQINVSSLQPVNYVDIEEIEVINPGFGLYLPIILR